MGLFEVGFAQVVGAHEQDTRRMKRWAVIYLIIYACGTVSSVPTAEASTPEAFSVVKERLKQLSTDIPLHHNKRVQSFIDYFVKKNRTYMRRVLAEQQRYFPIFEHYLAKHNLPDELKYLSVVESGLRPSAISRAGAVGLWQFMPSTARLYGLKQNVYVDERRDPHQATEAACLYLKYLHGIFNDWELALAAFNSGPGRVSRAIRRSGRKSFWKIYRHLPRETRSYLPQFVAITYVMNYYQHYNLFPEERFFAIKSDTIHISKGIDLNLLSEALNLCPSYLHALNPSYIRGVVPQDHRHHVLRIPTDKKQAFDSLRNDIINEVARASLPTIDKIEQQLKKKAHERKRIYHKVRKGDALSTIAQRYGVRVSEIKRWNRLRSSRIYAGKRLRIWVPRQRYARSKSTTRSRKAPTRSAKSYYIVERGDTLWSIAHKQAISIRSIKRLNNLRSNRIMPGQRLRLPK